MGQDVEDQKDARFGILLGLVQIGQNGFHPPVDRELLVYVVEMGLHRIDRNAELVSNVLVATPFRRIGKNLTLPLCQP